MKTAVIYARYSSDKQTEQSIEGQLHVCYDYAERNNIVVVGEYIDRAVSGKTDNRNDFQRMLKDSHKKAWDYVLVYKLDRFSRNKYEMATHKKTLKDNKIKLLSAMENIPDTPEGIILESLLEGMAEYYSVELAQKVRRGMNETRRKGNYTGGNLAYGYKVENKKIIINEDEANVVRYMFEEYAKGKTAQQISDALAEKGIYKYGKPFRLNTMYKMLANEKYVGIYRFNDEIFTNTYPQIISKEIYDIVSNKLARNKYGKKSITEPYLLRKKLKCGYCGGTMIGESGTAKSGQKKKYYKCSDKKLNHKCEKSQIRKDDIENLVINATLLAFKNKTTISQIADNILKYHQKRMQDNSVLNLLLVRKTEIETSISNLMTAIEQGIITSTTKTRLEMLEKEQLDLDNKILIEKNKDRIQLSKDEIIKFITVSLKKEPQYMLDLLVKEVVLYNDKVEIVYNYTSRTIPDDDKHQVFSFHRDCDNINLYDCYTNADYFKEIKINLLI